MVGKKNELDEGYSWTLLHLMDDVSGVYIDDVSGVYIDDEYLRTMCHSKLAVARRLMEECFEPIRDRHTRIKVIPSVVYNCRANFNRIHFGGFYAAVLEKEDEIISVASLRIHGSKVAEMPFIATSDVYRCKGMCRKLMVAIESESMKQEIMGLNTLMFHDSVRLQKPLLSSSHFAESFRKHNEAATAAGDTSKSAVSAGP
ncbi:Acyl-CoA N-acyltransferase with RING/FYVE/PHD-type zinc finger protein [Forsythia ovata]|uniref:Acyl-CoA N-acyltransferase with RING/FYVE/PHD-type zinc finger protein n=1 Tax=Forsythia ovata TaxID=205694 RepID=A0ABD1RSK1_9LAMI